jgi:hypothetical protein
MRYASGLIAGILLCSGCFLSENFPDFVSVSLLRVEPANVFTFDENGQSVLLYSLEISRAELALREITLLASGDQELVLLDDPTEAELAVEAFSIEDGVDFGASDTFHTARIALGRDAAGVMLRLVGRLELGDGTAADLEIALPATPLVLEARAPVDGDGSRRFILSLFVPRLLEGVDFAALGTSSGALSIGPDSTGAAREALGVISANLPAAFSEPF